MASSSRPSSNGQFSWWRDRAAPVLALGLMAGALWWTRPVHRLNYAPPGSMLRTQACLSNLGRIAGAFAQYAQDYDGKYPRGVDPEDKHFPELWRDTFRGDHYQDARTAPLLQDLLYPYLKDREVWHCPDDTGWVQSQLYQEVNGLSPSHLTNVKPSSFALYGTSYYYFTIHGFAGMRASDLRDPYSEVLLFDGDLWHQPGGSPSVNVLLGDGHVENMLPSEFRRHSRIGL